MIKTVVCEEKDGKPVGGRKPRFHYYVLKTKPARDGDEALTEFLLLDLDFLVPLTLFTFFSFALIMLGFSFSNGFLLGLSGVIGFFVALGIWFGYAAIYYLIRKDFFAH